jgi:16S rRNA G527 N7-methylase RsmG
LIDKSKKKTNFLKETVKKLNLNINVICKNIIEDEKEIDADVFIARAFKPLPTILKLIHNKEIKYKKFFVFLGKTGKKELLLASKIWDIKYKQHMSVTSSDSLIIEINNLKKK